MKRLILILACVWLFAAAGFAQTCPSSPCTLSTAGTYIWTVPTGVTSVAIVVNAAGGGGGGGACYDCGAGVNGSG